jgi:hypothetical protein
MDHHRKDPEVRMRGYRSAAKKYVTDFPDIAREWHPTRNGTRTPNTVRGTSAAHWWWQCEHGHEWQATAQQRCTRGSRCPVCTNRRGEASNSLATLRPDLASEWDYEANAFGPEDVTVGANRAVGWVCSTCGHRWTALVHARALQDSRCPKWIEIVHPLRPGNLRRGVAGPDGEKPEAPASASPNAAAADLPAWTQPEGDLFADDPPALDAPEAIGEDPDFPFG